MAKRIRILVLAAVFGVLCLELSERFLPPGVSGLRFHCRGHRWSPSDAGQRLGCCAQDSPTLFSGCVRLLNLEEIRSRPPVRTGRYESLGTRALRFDDFRS